MKYQIHSKILDLNCQNTMIWNGDLKCRYYIILSLNFVSSDVYTVYDALYTIFIDRFKSIVETSCPTYYIGFIHKEL